MTIGKVVFVTSFYVSVVLLSTTAFTQENPPDGSIVESTDNSTTQSIDESSPEESASDDAQERLKTSVWGPRTIVTSEQIEMSGVTNIEELLTQIPTFSFGGQKASHPGGNGVATVELRNLDPGRTLVLLNGRRIVGNAGPSVDLSIIPVAAIDRVEVLHAGASALYGADAVAGVVDIILKQDFNGFDVHALGGTSTHGDGRKFGASTTFGVAGEQGNLMLSLGYVHEDPVFQRDRSWANPPCEAVYYCGDGTEICSECGSTMPPGGNVSYYALDPSILSEAPNGWIFQGGEGDFHPASYVYENWLENPNGHPYDMYNWGEQQSLSGQSDRFQAVANGQFNFTDSVSAYVDGLFAYQRHGNRMAGEPVWNGYSNSLQIHLSNPFIPQQFWDQVIDVYGVNEDSPMMGMVKRFNDVGARVSETTSTTFRALAGLKGEIAKGYTWDVFGSYSRAQSIDIFRNRIDLQKLEIALDPELCLDTPGCVLANMFGEGTMQADVIDYIGWDDKETNTWDLINAGAMLSMALFELPGGSFTTIVGGDLQWLSAKRVPGNTIPDYVTESSPSGFSGKYNSQEGFVEITAPFIRDIPGAALVELDLAGRLSHFNPFGTEFSYGAGLIYAPLKDFAIRGSFSTSFKAPTLTQLYGESYTAYPQVVDPCSSLGSYYSTEYTLSQCQADGVPNGYVQMATSLPTEFGSNPDLKSETSRHVNLGTVFAPTFMPDRLPVSLTLDWYKIWVFGAARNLNAQTVLTNCYTVEGLDEYCDFVNRDEATGEITLIEATMKNINELEYAGFDLSFNMGFPLYKSIGGNFGFQWSVLREFTERNPDDITAGVPAEFASMNLAEEISPTGGGTPKFRYLTSLSIGDRSWTIENRLRYISGMDMRGVPPETAPYYKVPTMIYWDISARVRIFDFNLTLGVQNVLDKEPPYYPGTGYNANPQVYDLIGRYLFANLGYEFF